MNTLINTRVRWLACLMSYVFVVAVFLCGTSQTASAIARGYSSDDPNLQPGMVAALSDSSTAENPKVKRASQDDGEKIVGVTTTPDDELITLASGSVPSESSTRGMCRRRRSSS